MFSVGVADTLIFIPVPFQELSSEKYWTLDEQEPDEVEQAASQNDKDLLE